MKSSFTKNSGSLIDVQVELTTEEFKTYWQEVFDEALSKVHLKGFRPGQAPKELAAGAVDQEKVFEEAANNAIRYTLNEVIEENNWNVIDSPKITIEEETKFFKYRAELVLFPEIEIGDYKKIAKNEFSQLADRQNNLKIDSKEIDEAIEFLKKSGANLSNFQDDANLQKSIADGLLAEKKEYEKEKSRLKVLEEIAKNSKADIPQIMIDRTKQHHDQINSDQKISDEQARKDITNHLVIYKIAQLENLNPTKEEVEEEMARQGYRKKLDTAQFYDYIYSVLQNRKVFNFLEKI